MSVNQKQGVISIIGSIGVIILLAGIFLNNIRFDYALFVALSCWILAGVMTKFFGISRNGRILVNSGWKSGLVALIGGFGLIILLAGIFLNINFNIALFVAIVLWIISGIVATFLGVNKKEGYFGNNTDLYDLSSKSSNVEEGPAKQFCPVCGTSHGLDVLFCSNCGSNLH